MVSHSCAGNTCLLFLINISITTMKIEKKIDLFKYSTMRTHSVGTLMYTPERTDELIDIMSELHRDCYFLGGGSNVVFSSKVEKPIVNLMELNNEIRF